MSQHTVYVFISVTVYRKVDKPGKNSFQDAVLIVAVGDSSHLGFSCSTWDILAWQQDSDWHCSVGAEMILHAVMGTAQSRLYLHLGMCAHMLTSSSLYESWLWSKRSTKRVCNKHGCFKGCWSYACTGRDFCNEKKKKLFLVPSLNHLRDWKFKSAERKWLLSQWGSQWDSRLMDQ